MTVIRIERFETPFGTFGELTFDEFKCWTLEREWADNRRSVSCIPAGDYVLVPHDSPRFGKTWAVINELHGIYRDDKGIGRFGILIHPANVSTELEGCIAVGNRLGCIQNRWALTDSRAAFGELLKRLGDRDACMLRIAYKSIPR